MHPILLGGLMAILVQNGSGSSNPSASSCLAPVIVTTASRQKSGQKWQEAADWFLELPTLIDQSEVGALGPRDRLDKYLLDLVRERIITFVGGGTVTKPTYLMVAEVSSVDKKSIVHAFVNGCGSDLAGNEASLVVNLNGAFWRADYTINGFRGGTAAARMAISLHELCHVFECQGFRSDGGNPSISQANNGIVRTLFSKTFATLERK